MIGKFDESVLGGLYRVGENSHKGQNGKVLVIGGSKLFHASIFWSADTASRVVDMVHFTSPANENNDLVRQKIKAGFWSGIVVDWSEVESYIEEDDVVLIGPGMVRSEDSQVSGFPPVRRAGRFPAKSAGRQVSGLDNTELVDVASSQDDTRAIVNHLLAKYPEKKWVVDGGALQEVEVGLLNNNHIITPHFGELTRLFINSKDEFLISNVEFLNNFQLTNNQMTKLIELVSQTTEKLGGATILLKGKVDVVCRGEECVVVEGGNPGMTKGGTGDVLAGMVAGLYCKNEAFLAAQAASYLTKRAGDSLHKRVGTFYNAGDLVEEVGRVCKKELD